MSSRALPACCFVLLQGCLAEANPMGSLIMMNGLTLQTFLGHSWALAATREPGYLSRTMLRQAAVLCVWYWLYP